MWARNTPPVWSTKIMTATVSPRVASSDMSRALLACGAGGVGGGWIAARAQGTAGGPDARGQPALGPARCRRRRPGCSRTGSAARPRRPRRSGGPWPLAGRGAGFLSNLWGPLNEPTAKYLDLYRSHTSTTSKLLYCCLRKFNRARGSDHKVEPRGEARLSSVVYTSHPFHPLCIRWRCRGLLVVACQQRCLCPPRFDVGHHHSNIVGYAIFFTIHRHIHITAFLNQRHAQNIIAPDVVKRTTHHLASKIDIDAVPARIVGARAEAGMRRITMPEPPLPPT
jgi:hypothetical protein